MIKKRVKIAVMAMILTMTTSMNVFAEDDILDSISENAVENLSESIEESVSDCVHEIVEENVLESDGESNQESVQENTDTLEESYDDQTEVYINPLYDNVLNEYSLNSDMVFYNIHSMSVDYYQNWSEVVQAVRYAMTSRVSTVSIDFESSDTLAPGWLQKLLSEVMQESSSSVEGDYLECHFGGCKSSRKTTKSNEKYYHHIDLSFTYYTTAEQEAVVTEHVNRLLSGFGFTSETSDYDKIKTIYDWLCENVNYDYTNLSNESYKLKFSAYAAIVNRTAVCQGYTSLAYRLLKEAGVNARIITGTSSGERHAWLIVELDGLYYNLDPTWDSSNTSYKYFLKGENNFAKHTRAAEFITDAFYQKYPMSDGDYTYSKSVTETKAFVTQLYQVCLEREPDGGGLQTWVNQLASGASTGTQAAHGFVFSKEFLDKNLCNEDYVKLLYKAFLGREADAGGLEAWVKILEDGKTREYVFNGFAMSNEFGKLCTKYGILRGEAIKEPIYGTLPNGNCSVCGKEDGITGFVKRLYKVCLNREADTGGLNDWCDALRGHRSTGRDVAYGFIFSNEFTNKKLSNEDYVEHLYRAFMGRDSDAGGKAVWVNALKEGKTRKYVFDGFVGSKEFTAICNSYGILRD